MRAMRLAWLLLLGCMATGCGVPEVTFVDDAGLGATHDAFEDRAAEAAAEASADATGDAESSTGDAGYCIGADGGTPPPNGLACCPGGMGKACAGECMAKACMACGNCPWPSVCCTNGANGTCKPYC
jgi:hypothetical protein